MLPSPVCAALLACLLLCPTPARCQDLPAHADSRDTLVGLADGMTLETLPGSFVLAATPRSGTRVVDPHYSLGFDRSVVVYASAGPRLDLRLTVHYESGDQDNALRTARLAACLIHLHNRRLQHTAKFPRDAETADLWLVRVPAADSSVGGETRSNNVYIYGTASPRTDAEWVRTIAHELGHLLLPAARGYARPEADAGGELGERLFQRWLVAEAPEPGGIWSLSGVGAPVRDRATALADRFRQRGPHDPAIQKRDAAAMELYIGAALAFEDAFGSPLLGTALYGIDTEDPQELLDAMRRAVFRIETASVKLPAWVPFGDGAYAFTAITGKGTLAIDKRPAFAPDAKRPLSIQTPGWKYVRTGSGDLSAVRITRKRS